MHAKPKRTGHNQFPTSGMSPMERYEFYVRAEDRGYLTPCWIWAGNGETSNGYASMQVTVAPNKQRQVIVHRWRWEQDNGPVPDGLQLDHLCRQRLCSRPDHLELTTPLENSRRGRNAKLTDGQAAEIFNRSATERTAVLAEEFGVSMSTVQLIKKNGPYGPRTPSQNARHRAARRRRRLEKLGTAPE